MPFGDNESARNAVVQLIGRYLNAARVGRPKLEAAYNKRRSKDQSWVPRFEEDGIELEDSDRDILGAFGASPPPDEFSLFPFNRSALRQLPFGGNTPAPLPHLGRVSVRAIPILNNGECSR